MNGPSFVPFAGQDPRSARNLEARSRSIRDHRHSSASPDHGTLPALRRSKRVHSRYERTLADLPWSAYTVTVRRRVRRATPRPGWEIQNRETAARRPKRKVPRPST